MSLTLHVPSDYTEEDIAIPSLYRGEALQVRQLEKERDLRVRPEIVQDYEKLYLDGHDLGPLSVIREIRPDGTPTGRLLLGDGYHRSEARMNLAQRFPQEAAIWGRVRCRVYTGDAFTAVLVGAHGNGGRGLQLTLADRKKVAEMMLVGLAKRGVTWSNERIGKWAGIDSETVAGVRQQLESRFTLPTTREVETKNGRTYRMTPAPRDRSDTPASYQDDELLDQMPNAEHYIAPPQAQQPAYPPRTRSNGSPTGPRGAGDYRAPPPVTRQPAAAYTPPSGMTTHWDQDSPDADGTIPAAVGLPGYGSASDPRYATTTVVDEDVAYSLSWSRIGPDGRPEHGTLDQDSISSLPADIKARLLRDLGVR